MIATPTTVRAPALFSLTSSGQELVKVAAFAFMLVDHIGAVFLEGDVYVIARVLGRLAFPLFAFLVAYNVVRRGFDPLRYVGPLALLGVISQAPYMLLLGARDLNIMWTLLAGVALLAAYRRVLEVEDGRRVWLIVGAVLLVAGFGAVTSYGYAGVLLPLAFAWVLAQPVALHFVIVAVGLVALNPWHLGMVLPLALLPLLEVVSRIRLGVPRLPRWLWLVSYPSHLVLLLVVAWGIGVV